MLPALYGLVISLPLGIIAARWRWFYPPVLTVVNILYAVPSLALFIALIPAFGLTDTTVIIALTVFSLCVILPNVVAGLRAVPAAVTQAATAMGYGPLRRLVTVELPLAVPVIIAGLRVGVVAEHQPGQRRPAHRRVQPRLPVHRRAAAVLPDRDLRRPLPGHRARPRLRPDPGRRQAGAHPVGGPAAAAGSGGSGCGS